MTGYNQDNIPEATIFATVFRNQLTGFEPGKIQQTNPVILAAHSRYANLVGNVLGTSGVQTIYEDSQLPGPRAFRQVDLSPGVVRGRGNNRQRMPYDPLVATTVLRWGNYDYMTRQTRWNASEIPAARRSPSQTLPASFFLSAKPTWWGRMPWPAIGPGT